VIVPEPSAAVGVTAADGARLTLRRHGNAAGPRVFVSHGNGFAADGYFPFWRHFLDRFDVVVFDMRNHGHNPLGDPANHDYAHMAGDIAAVRDAAAAEFGARPAIGLFHSMSAQSAMLAAGAGFDALVLFDPPNVPPEPGPVREKMLAYLARLTEWAAARRAVFDDPSELAGDYAGTGAGRHWAAGSHELVARSVLRSEPDGKWRLVCPPAYESDMYAQGVTVGLWPPRVAIACPVKLIGGDPERARPSPTALANQTLAAEHGYDYAAIPGTGHLLQLEQPDICAAVALEFLEGIGIR
jgi:pimeloyl-ACP methyl ester carboxylesterase